MERGGPKPHCDNIKRDTHNTIHSICTFSDPSKQQHMPTTQGNISRITGEPQYMLTPFREGRLAPLHCGTLHLNNSTFYLWCPFTMVPPNYGTPKPQHL